MSNASLITNVKLKQRIYVGSRLSMASSHVDSSKDLKKQLKIQKSTLSPYASKSIQLKSFEKTADFSFTRQNRFYSKEKLGTVASRPSKKILTLSSLIGESRNKQASISKICRKLEKKLQNTNDSDEIFLEVLEEIINNEKEFTSVLKLLKIKIDTYLKSKKTEKEKFKSKAEKLEIINKNLTENILRLTKKINQLTEELQVSHLTYTEISDKFIKIMQVNVDSSEFTTENFVRLKQKVVVFNDMVFSLKDELDFFKKKAKKFCKLFNLLEQKGVPVEEIYLTEMKKSKALPNYHGESDPESNTDNEYLHSVRSNIKRKPNNVPLLEILGVERESDSDSSVSSEGPEDRLFEF